MDYRLTNNGSHPFKTAQYVHNFTRIADQPVGPDYEVSVSWPFTATNLNRFQPVAQEGNKLVYSDSIRSNNKPVIPVDDIGESDFEFVVRQTALDKGLRVSADWPDNGEGATAEALAIAVWSMNNSQLSPEQFVVLDVEPGKTVSWSRTYQIIPEPSGIVLMTLGFAAMARRSRRRRR